MAHVPVCRQNLPQNEIEGRNNSNVYCKFGMGTVHGNSMNITG